MPSKTSPLRLLLAAAIVAGGATMALPSLAVDTGGNGGGSSGGGGASTSSTVTKGFTMADARAAIKAKKWKTAVSILKKIVAKSPGNADALNLLGYSLRKTGDTRNAQGFYLKALKIEPSHKGANEYLGELYVEIGQLKKAQQRLKALEAICGNTTCEEYQDLAKFIKAAS